MTRYKSMKFLVDCFGFMEGGEIFIPKTPSMRITDLARAVCPKCKQEITGILPGEKLHELIISQEESINTAEFEDYHVIYPLSSLWTEKEYFKFGVKRVPEGFEYTSDANSEWVSIRELEEMM